MRTDSYFLRIPETLYFDFSHYGARLLHRVSFRSIIGAVQRQIQTLFLYSDTQ